MNYAQLLRLPQWHRRRARIMERDGYKCSDCGKGEGPTPEASTPLQVHHTRGYDGRLPWEYPDERLVTLCDDCHLARHGSAPTDPEALAGWSAKVQLRIKAAGREVAEILAEAEELRRARDVLRAEGAP